MTDFADDSSVGSLLDGDSLRSVEFPTVRKGGLDPAAVARTLTDAANQLDSLHSVLDSRDRELREIAGERDAALEAAGRADALLAQPSPEADIAGATTLLANAQRVAEETIAEAEAEAARVLESVETARAEAAEIRANAALEAEETRERANSDAEDIVANARARAEAEVDDLSGQIAGLRAQRDAERADLDAQFEEYRALAVAAHERAVGSLAAAVASLEGYVASVAENEEPRDVVIDTESVEVFTQTLVDDDLDVAATEEVVLAADDDDSSELGDTDTDVVDAEVVDADESVVEGGDTGGWGPGVGNSN